MTAAAAFRHNASSRLVFGAELVGAGLPRGRLYEVMEALREMPPFLTLAWEPGGAGVLVMACVERQTYWSMRADALTPALVAEAIERLSQ